MVLIASLYTKIKCSRTQLMRVQLHITRLGKFSSSWKTSVVSIQCPQTIVVSNHRQISLLSGRKPE